MVEPRELAEQFELGVVLPAGSEERFAGYGVMGQPFASGHLLALRRFPVTSLGAGYTSIWHRDPAGVWTFVQDAPPERSCPRYFGSALSRTLVRDIRIVWSGPRAFTVSVNGDWSLEWQVALSSNSATRAFNLAAGLLPLSVWRKRRLLDLIGRTASRLTGMGRITLTGQVPNRQRFLSQPRYVWKVAASRARLNGVDLGPPGPLADQANLADVWLPQEGRFFVGYSFLESFDPARHIEAPPPSA
ncbi:MAG: hypothetical protein P8Y63_00540 [Deltaproteobacteria bacterium]|jgi:hypothetical protein